MKTRKVKKHRKKNLEMQKKKLQQQKQKRHKHILKICKNQNQLKLQLFQVNLHFNVGFTMIPVNLYLNNNVEDIVILYMFSSNDFLHCVCGINPQNTLENNQISRGEKQIFLFLFILNRQQCEKVTVVNRIVDHLKSREQSY